MESDNRPLPALKQTLSPQKESKIIKFDDQNRSINPEEKKDKVRISHVKGILAFIEGEGLD